MDKKTYNRTNFHRYTFCVFQEVNLSEIDNRQPDYKSKSGSSYYFNETGVLRLSNHWGRAANCKWRIESGGENHSRTKLGFALWTSFHPDNDNEKLYFITVDFAKETVSYQHKNSGNAKNAMLRTASETTKTVKQIRNLFTNNSWTNYFENNNIEDLKRNVIEKLITTNQSLLEIKSSIRIL